jgi:hypothetical protein
MMLYMCHGRVPKSRLPLALYVADDYSTRLVAILF